MQHIFAVLEDLPAVSEFPEKSATAVVLIAGQLDLERKGMRRDGGGKVAASKGIDSPTEAQDLLGVTRKLMIYRCVSSGWCDGIEFSEGNRVNREMAEAVARR